MFDGWNVHGMAHFAKYLLEVKQNINNFRVLWRRKKAQNNDKKKNFFLCPWNFQVKQDDIQKVSDVIGTKENCLDFNKLGFNSRSRSIWPSKRDHWAKEKYLNVRQWLKSVNSISRIGFDNFVGKNELSNSCRRKQKYRLTRVFDASTLRRNPSATQMKWTQCCRSVSRVRFVKAEKEREAEKVTRLLCWWPEIHNCLQVQNDVMAPSMLGAQRFL